MDARLAAHESSVTAISDEVLAAARQGDLAVFTGALHAAMRYPHLKVTPRALRSLPVPLVTFIAANESDCNGIYIYL